MRRFSMSPGSGPSSGHRSAAGVPWRTWSGFLITYAIIGLLIDSPARSPRSSTMACTTRTPLARAARHSSALLSMIPSSAASAASSGPLVRSPMMPRCISQVTTAVWAGETSSRKSNAMGAPRVRPARSPSGRAGRSVGVPCHIRSGERTGLLDGLAGPGLHRTGQVDELTGGGQVDGDAEALHPTLVAGPDEPLAVLGGRGPRGVGTPDLADQGDARTTAARSSSASVAASVGEVTTATAGRPSRPATSAAAAAKPCTGNDGHDDRAGRSGDHARAGATGRPGPGRRRTSSSEVSTSARSATARTGWSGQPGAGAAGGRRPAATPSTSARPAAAVVVVGVGLGPARAASRPRCHGSTSSTWTSSLSTSSASAGSRPATITRSQRSSPASGRRPPGARRHPRQAGSSRGTTPSAPGAATRRAPVRRTASATPSTWPSRTTPEPTTITMSSEAIDGERVTRRSSTGLKVSGSTPSGAGAERSRSRSSSRAAWTWPTVQPATAPGSCETSSSGWARTSSPGSDESRMRRPSSRARPGRADGDAGEPAVGVGEQGGQLGRRARRRPRCRRARAGRGPGPGTHG